MNYRLISFLLIFILSISICYAKKDKDEKIKIEKTVVTTGMSTITDNDVKKARDLAIRDAQVKAIEQVVGVFIDAETIAKDFTTVNDKIYTNTKGFIKSYKIVEDSEKTEEIEGNPVYSLKIEAEINISQVYEKLSDIKNVYEKLNKPKFCVWAKTSSNLGYDEAALIESMFTKKFKEWGFDTVDKTIISLKVGSEDYADNLYDTLKSNKIKLLVCIEANSINRDGGWSENSKSQISIKFVDLDNGEVYYTKAITGEANKFWGIGSGNITQAIKNGLNTFFRRNEKELKAELFNKWMDIANYDVITLKISNLKNKDINAFKDKVLEADPFAKNCSKHSLIKGVMVFDVITKSDIDSLAGYLETITFNDKTLKFDTIDRNVIEASLE